VSWSARRALSCETLVLLEALTLWNIQARSVSDLDSVIATLIHGNLRHEQTC